MIALLSIIGLIALAALFIAVVVRNLCPGAGKHPAHRRLDAIAAENARIQRQNGF